MLHRMHRKQGSPSSVISVRNLPPEVARAIRQKAKKEGPSLNRAVVKLLEEATGVVRAKREIERHDLDRFAGTWSEEEYQEFMESLGEQPSISRCGSDSSAPGHISVPGAPARPSGREARASSRAEVQVSAVVRGELRAGFLKGSRPSRNEEQRCDLLAAPYVRVRPVDEETSEPDAVIHDYLGRQGTPVSPDDLWIAGSAAQHGLRLLTLDQHFTRIPHILVDHVEPLSPS